MSAKLLTTKRFAPLFYTQFLGAFNDNFYKNALIILITYKVSLDSGMSADQLIALCGGLFIAPFFLFSAIAGQLADKYPKQMLIQRIKIAEIFIMLLAALGFYLEHVGFLVAILFLMGAQSAFFGPVKFGILPQLLKEEELVGGNAFIELGTFLSILLGTIVGGLLIMVEPAGPIWVSLGVIVTAVAGWLTSIGIPQLKAEAPSLKVSLNPITPALEIYRVVKPTRAVYLSILGAAWFWFYGASLLTLFPTYCKGILYGNEQMVTFFLALFSIGIGLGSLLCERLSFGKLELGLVPIGSVGMTLFLMDLYFVGSPYGASKPETLVGVAEFFRVAPASWRITIDLTLLSLFCGLYIVPLNTLIQQRSEASHRSRIISGFNVLSAVFMVVSSLMLMGFHAVKMPVPYIFLTIALMNFAIALYIYLLIPEFFYRFLCWVMAHVWYRFRVKHLERLPEEGAALLVCNHVSFVDWMLIAAAPRRPIRFVMHYSFMKIPVFNWMCRQGNIIPIASKKEDPKVLEEAFKKIAEELDAGNMVCIFPEGQITKDGEINTFRPGVERILERNPVPVYPLALRGLWGSFFTRKYGRAMSSLKFRFGALVELEIGEALPPELASAERLQELVAGMRGDAK